MNRFVIVCDMRHPRNKAEKNLFGRTYIGRDLHNIFLNAKQSHSDMFDTLIHEFLHVVCGVCEIKPKMRHRTEEKLVRRATDAVKAVLLGKRK